MSRVSLHPLTHTRAWRFPGKSIPLQLDSLQIGHRNHSGMVRKGREEGDRQGNSQVAPAGCAFVSHVITENQNHTNDKNPKCHRNHDDFSISLASTWICSYYINISLCVVLCMKEISLKQGRKGSGCCPWCCHPPQFLTFKGWGPIHLSTCPATSPRFLSCLVSAALEHHLPLF